MSESERRIVEANIKLMDRIKWTEKDARLLIQYIKGNDDIKKAMKKEVKAIIKRYEETQAMGEGRH